MVSVSEINPRQARRRAALFRVEMVIVLVAAGFGGFLSAYHPEVKISATKAIPLGALLILSGPLLLGNWDFQTTDHVMANLIATMLLALIASGYFYPSKTTRRLSIIGLSVWLFFGLLVLGLNIT